MKLNLWSKTSKQNGSLGDFNLIYKAEDKSISRLNRRRDFPRYTPACVGAHRLWPQPAYPTWGNRQGEFQGVHIRVLLARPPGFPRGGQTSLGEAATSYGCRKTPTHQAIPNCQSTQEMGKKLHMKYKDAACSGERSFLAPRPSTGAQAHLLRGKRIQSKA
jgi:hypothetical protein